MATAAIETPDGGVMEGGILAQPDRELARDPTLAHKGGSQIINSLYHDDLNSVIYTTPTILRIGSETEDFQNLSFGKTATINITKTIISSAYLRLGLKRTDMTNVFAPRGWGFMAFSLLRLKVEGLGDIFTQTPFENFAQALAQCGGFDKINSMIIDAGDAVVDAANDTVDTYEAIVPLSVLFWMTMNGRQKPPVDWDLFLNNACQLQITWNDKDKIFGGTGVTNSAFTGWDFASLEYHHVAVKDPSYTLGSNPVTPKQEITHSYPFVWARTYTPVGSTFTGNPGAFHQFNLTGFEEYDLAGISVYLLKNERLQTSSPDYDQIVGKLLTSQVIDLQVRDGADIVYRAVGRKSARVFDRGFSYGDVQYLGVTLRPGQSSAPFQVLPTIHYIPHIQFSLGKEQQNTGVMWNTPSFFGRKLTVQFKVEEAVEYTVFFILFYNNAVHWSGKSLRIV